MAPPRSHNARVKKHTLTLAQIASYDDILTDALVDHAFYWTTIPKNRPSYLPSRGVKEEEVAQIIQKHLVVTPDLHTAEDQLLATNGLGKFYRTLKTDAEKEDFRRHLRRYMQIYLPDCPFEVASTNRYTIFQEEASICARRFIKPHETIKYLSGIQVVITPEEEAQLSARKKDFSIVVSSRKKEVNLFMGPARFANHDCDANARLVTTGQSGIEIIATKSIGVGDEITVTYGDSYFGDDNCECLCKTCEVSLVNGWAPADGSVPVKQSIEGCGNTPAQGYSLRRRDDNSFNCGRSETPSLTPTVRPKIFRASLLKLVRNSDTTLALPGSPMGEATQRGHSQSRGQKRELDSLLATPPVTPAKKMRTTPGRTPRMAEAFSRKGSSNICENTPAVDAGLAADLVILSPTPKRVPVADTITVFQEKVIVRNTGTPNQMPTPESLSETVDSDTTESDAGESTIVVAGAETKAVEEEIPALKMEESSDTIEVLALATPDLSTDDGEDEKSSNTEISAEVSGQLDNETEDTKADASEKNESDDETDAAPSRQRVPGDYTMTPLLLSEPETAWVVCTVCTKAFVQRNAYFTRMSCPRCERHSKIYGYMWPKTEPEGKSDKEERILDHRLVHRFLHAGDEAVVRGRKQATLRAELTANGDHDNQRTPSSNPAGSGIWRKLRYTDVKKKTTKAANTSKGKSTLKATRTANTTSTTSVRSKATVKAVQSGKRGSMNKTAESTPTTALAKTVRMARQNARPRRASAQVSYAE